MKQNTKDDVKKEFILQQEQIFFATKHNSQYASLNNHK